MRRFPSPKNGEVRALLLDFLRFPGLKIFMKNTSHYDLSQPLASLEAIGELVSVSRPFASFGEIYGQVSFESLLASLEAIGEPISFLRPRGNKASRK